MSDSRRGAILSHSSRGFRVDRQEAPAIELGGWLDVGGTMLAFRCLSATAVALFAVTTIVSPSQGQTPARSGTEAVAELPKCGRAIGTVAVYQPDKDWWTPLGLGSPEALIKQFVRRSGCFVLVDRSAGMSAAEKERSLAASGMLQQGSNMGGGQMRAADYIIVPDIVDKNENASGSNIGGLVAGFAGRFVPGAALLGGLSINSKTADVVLTLTNVRTSEQVASEEGNAKKSSLGWGGAGAGFAGSGLGVVAASGYTNTDIGKVVTLAYLQSYTKLVGDLANLAPAAPVVAPAPAQVATGSGGAVSLARPGRLFAGPSPDSKVVRALSPGTMLYPTGKVQGIFEQVSDDEGRQGWVSTRLIVK